MVRNPVVSTILIFLLVNGLANGQSAVTITGSLVFDGLGTLLENQTITIKGDHIETIVNRSTTDRSDYNLSGLTVLPGLIDTHVHLDWHFDQDDRFHSDDNEPPEEKMLYAAGNAYDMLLAGMTTIQSLGSPTDKPLRDAVNAGILPGPRILTSLQSVSAQTGDPETIRNFVRQQKHNGADVIKVFGSASIRDGGKPTMSQEQLNAACGEATTIGLRSVVHAHGSESARRSVLAGCTTIEHGALLNRNTLNLLSKHKVFLDPHIHLIFDNYFKNKHRYIGIGNYSENGFKQMESAVPKALESFKQGLKVKGLNIIFGTDAVAGAHGKNVEELIYRVTKGGQDPNDALVSATSLAARSLGLEHVTGKLSEGMAADLIAVEGNPLSDITSLRQVRFVMKAGVVVKYLP